MAHFRRRFWPTLLALVVMGVAAWPAAAQTATPTPAPSLLADQAYLGIAYDRTPDGAGVRVVEVAADSPAAAAGVQAGDVLLLLGMQPVSVLTLAEQVRALAPNTAVQLVVARDGTLRLLEATLGSRPADLVTPPGLVPQRPAVPPMMLPLPREVPRAAGLLGVTVVSGPDGPVVERVLPGTRAEQVGFQPGDVIVRIDGAPVATPDDVRRAARPNDPFASISVDVLRDGTPLTLTVPPLAEPRALSLPNTTLEGALADVPVTNLDALGIQVVAVDARVADALGLEQRAGALVINMLPGSLAFQAGLRSRDVIVAVDGQGIDASNPLVALLARRAPGDTVTFTVARGRGPQRTITLVLPAR